MVRLTFVLGIAVAVLLGACTLMPAATPTPTSTAEDRLKPMFLSPDVVNYPFSVYTFPHCQSGAQAQSDIPDQFHVLIRCEARFEYTVEGGYLGFNQTLVLMASKADASGLMDRWRGYVPPASSAQVLLPEPRVGEQAFFTYFEQESWPWWNVVFSAGRIAVILELDGNGAKHVGPEALLPELAKGLEFRVHTWAEQGW